MQTLFQATTIDFLAALYDPATGRSHLFVQQGSGTLYWTSSDDGATWATGNINFSLPSFFTSAYPAVANGIAIDGQFCTESSCNNTAGRLVVPYVCHGNPAAAAAHLRARRAGMTGGDIACPGCYSCMLISDDHGASWRLGGYSLQDGSREASIVQANTSAWTSGSSGKQGAVVYASERSMGNETGHKLYAVSFDGAASFTSFGSSPVPDGDTKNWTGVVTGMARFDTPLSGPSGGIITRRIVQAVPNSLTARADLALYVSTDEGQTWSTTGNVVQPGPTGYTAAWQLNATHFAVLFENGASEFAEQISFGLATVDDLPLAAAATVRRS